MAADYYKKYQEVLDQKIQNYFGKDDSPPGVVIQYRVSKPVMPAKNKKFFVWDFDLRGSKWSGQKSHKIAPLGNADFYLLLGLLNDKPEKIFLIPAYGISVTHVRIPLSGNSKYYQYVI